MTFTAAGRQLEGKINVGPETIALELEVPFIFRLFRDRAVAVMDAEVRRIERAREGGSGTS